jgi:predicted metalloprotease
MSDENNTEMSDPEKEDIAKVTSPETEVNDITETDTETESETEEDRNEDSVDGDEIDKNNTPEDGVATPKKYFKILKWAAIALIPIVAVAVLFYLKPDILTKSSNKPEKLIHTPKTAAIQWTAVELEMINVVGQTLAETEKIWNNIFTKKGGIYKKPDFTIYTERISSVCIDNSADPPEPEKIIEKSSIGTFYCPEERRIYIDLSLHLDLKNRLDIPGDFAQGYIVAHEIGHHVQNLAGISEQIPAARLALGKKEFDMVLQRMELQADCFAGIWAKHTTGKSYNTSQEEFVDALSAVSHYSREHLKQKRADETMPDPFNHSSSRLRLRWFTMGYDKGTFDACDTFTTMEL